jgi:hypothetical protein
MPTGKQSHDFMEFVMPNSGHFLEEALAWIKDNLDPEEVFAATQLEKWAESEGYIKATDND